MAYNSDYLSAVSHMGGKAGNTLWTYTTTDATAAIEGAGYVSDATDQGMTVGDVLIVTKVTALPNTTPLGVSLYIVDSIASGAATVDLAAVT